MTDSNDLHMHAWSAPRWHEALSILARKAGFLSNASEPLPAYQGKVEDGRIEQWLDLAGQKIGLESEAVTLPYAELESGLRRIGPALVRLPGETPGLLAVLKGGKHWIEVVTPEHTIRRIPSRQLRDALAQELEASVAPALQELLDAAGIAQERRAAVTGAVLREQLGPKQIGGCWLLRLSPGDDFLKQLRHARLPRGLGVALGASVAAQFLFVLAWWVIGEGALAGHFEWAWMWAWGLLLFSMIPLQLLNTWAQGAVSLGLGRLLKQRLLYGILQLEPEEIRHQGSGRFMGLVMETASFESLALGGGLTALTALLELALAGVVLALGAGGMIHASLLLGWLVFAGVLGWRYYRHADAWMAFYRELSNDLVERMVGQRTRLAQEALAAWHEEEDRLLARYAEYAERADRTQTRFKGVVERGWMIVGLAGAAYPFITTPEVTAALAVSLGGMLLALQALNHLVTGATNVVEVVVAWRQLGPLFHAAARKQPVPSHFVAPEEIQQDQTHAAVLSARDVSFAYRPESPILQACGLEIQKGDRVLLEGPSGGGKSTLAALLSGLRAPQGGELRLWGFGQQALGLDAWRKRVVAAPQFHENHVLTETFAFNLLMGRRWPPHEEDVEEAVTICRELGLEDLLARMPAGLLQMVGESGWQLSHGERSRLYIARALLQQADLIILDESFAALDPENLARALRCVLRRAPALLVIAHP